MSNHIVLCCPQCGGRLDFDIEMDVVQCEYCDSLLNVSELLNEGDEIRKERYLRKYQTKMNKIEQLQNQFVKLIKIKEKQNKSFNDVKIDKTIMKSKSFNYTSILWLIVIICCISVYRSITSLDKENDQKIYIDFSNYEMAEYLPDYEDAYGVVKIDSVTNFHVDLYDVSLYQVQNYRDLCIDYGYIYSVKDYTNSYSGYNQENYKLYLNYKEEEGILSIKVNAPDEYETINWPSSGLASLIPKPSSNDGLLYGTEDKFFAIMDKTTKSDFDAYKQLCVEAGFTFNVLETDGFYEAEDKEGRKLIIFTEGYNQMYISLEKEGGV